MKKITFPIALAVLLPLAGCGGDGSKHDASNVPNSPFIFTSTRDENDEVYAGSLDGSFTQRLTNNSADDSACSVSPDGSKILFVSTRDGNEEVYVMNSDGSNQTNLTNNAANESQARWTPDGNSIVFVSVRTGHIQVFKMNPDGSNQTNLTNTTSNDTNPSVSPDGSKVLFSSGRAGNGLYDLYTMNLDGSNQTVLLSGVSASEPAYSSDGTRIAFVFGPGEENDIAVMDADGSNMTQLTSSGSTIDAFPSWTQDGAHIVFTSDRDNGIEQLFIMDADGTHQKNISHTSAHESNPFCFPIFITKM